MTPDSVQLYILLPAAYFDKRPTLFLARSSSPHTMEPWSSKISVQNHLNQAHILGFTPPPWLKPMPSYYSIKGIKPPHIPFSPFPQWSQRHLPGIPLNPINSPNMAIFRSLTPPTTFLFCHVVLLCSQHQIRLSKLQAHHHFQLCFCAHFDFQRYHFLPIYCFSTSIFLRRKCNDFSSPYLFPYKANFQRFVRKRDGVKSYSPPLSPSFPFVLDL